MEESKDKEGNIQEFLGKKRELPEINLDSISNGEKQEKIKTNKNNNNNLSKNNINKNLCKICRKSDDIILKFKNIKEIISYLKEEKKEIKSDLILEENKNNTFNGNKIICKECLKKIVKDKDKFNEFFIQPIEIINDDSDVDGEINIYEDQEQPIVINDIENSKNENVNGVNKIEEKEKEQIQEKEKEKEDEKEINTEINNFQKNEEKKILDKNIIPENKDQIITDDNNNNLINMNQTENDGNLNQINMNYNANPGGNLGENIQNLILLNAYLANMNMLNQNIDAEQNKSTEDKNQKNSEEDNNTINFNNLSPQEQQAFIMNNALLQLFSYNQINQLYNANLIQNQLALYANLNNNINNTNDNINNNITDNNTIKENNINTNETNSNNNKNMNLETSEKNLINVNKNNNEINKDLNSNNEINKTKLEENNNINSISNHNLPDEKKKMTEVEKSIEELKNQIANVKNCLIYEDQCYNILCELENKFQTEILGIKDFKDKWTQIKMNLINNNNVNLYQNLINNFINQNQLYQLILNNGNQVQNNITEDNNQTNTNDINNQNIINNLITEENNIHKEIENKDKLEIKKLVEEKEEKKEEVNVEGNIGVENKNEEIKKE